MRLARSIMAIVALTPLLGGCGNAVKETLGINKKAPDEFKVIARPPLSVPPEFSLRPPADGSEGDSLTSPREEARSAVFSGDKSTTSPLMETPQKSRLMPGRSATAVTPVTSGTLGGSSAESKFLRNAGADQVDIGIREEMNREAALKQNEEASTFDVLTTLPDKKEPVVDAKGEAQRLMQNKNEGKPVTEGETPESRPTDRGILGRIFGD